ncbi:Lsr2 family protein [Arthrobacter sp. ISL-28]|uniref:histone-like nucleoid-structuring protein Lsr2 n=1 Tax=Arthrobacter sp. ISL-28 TaxID=2819108 RepID=UPI001BE61AE4|nr:Lsr2 family protein [Arthrobacter sp. ISL-28]MBT2522496.1 Lsr2 family protein [Arthrobacter sp. ISL-28]
MAKRVITTLEDDLDGSEANETITFSIDGTEYEIDLNDAHANELREAMNKYTSVARKSVGRAKQTRRASNGNGNGNTDTKAVRAWAIENGIPISTRGRIQADVMERYAQQTREYQSGTFLSNGDS